MTGPFPRHGADPSPAEDHGSPDHWHDQDLLEALRRDGVEPELGSESDLRRALDAFTIALGEDPPADLAALGLPSDFELRGALGRGASGVVVRAWQTSLAREVAIKVLATPGDPREAERLLAEARRLATLAHPGIVQVHEVGRVAGGVYVVLELLPGGSLQGLLARGPLGPGHAARLVRQVAEALAHSHARGVVHLDLKPGNVLIDAAGDTKVADFGLARDAGPERASGSSSRGLVGTPEYMAPEQAADRRERFDERTDVHGLGALLYACLTGRPPYQASSLVETLDAVRFGEPPRLARVAPDVPHDLMAIVDVALAKDPRDRYQTARALAEDLARFEAGTPVTARPPGALRRVALAASRRRSEVAVGFVAVLATALSLAPFRSAGPLSEQRWIDAAERALARGELREARAIVAELQRGALADHREKVRVRALDVEVASAEARVFEPARPLDIVPLASVAHDTGRPLAAATDAPVTVLVDTWIVMDDGESQRLWSGHASGNVGDSIRLEGLGRITLPLPVAGPGLDLFAIAPAEARPRPAWAGKSELGGRLVAQADDVVLDVTDREVWLALGNGKRSMFVHFNGAGPSTRGAQLIEAQRYRFAFGPDRGCTVLMFAELLRGDLADDAKVQRDLQGWTSSIAEALRRGMEELELALPLEPHVRAALADQALSCVLLSEFGGRSSLAALESTLATQGVEAATLIEGLSERGRFAGVTTSGADLGEWLALARELAPAPPSAVIDALPEPRSMHVDSSLRPRGREWLWIGYLVAAAGLILLAVLRPRLGERMLPALGVAVVFAAITLDKQVGTPWGALSCDVIACLELAVATALLHRAAPPFAAWAAVGFGVAALQGLGVWLLAVPDVRLPLVLAFTALALVPRALAPKSTHPAVGALLVFVLLAAYLVGLLELGSGQVQAIATYTTFGTTLVIVVLVSLASAARARA